MLRHCWALNRRGGDWRLCDYIFASDQTFPLILFKLVTLFDIYHTWDWLPFLVSLPGFLLTLLMMGFKLHSHSRWPGVPGCLVWPGPHSIRKFTSGGEVTTLCSSHPDWIKKAELCKHVCPSDKDCLVIKWVSRSWILSAVAGAWSLMCYWQEPVPCQITCTACVV